ncbi:MAG: hypothetical protein V1744_06415 [Candidatus Altiarchaeota archaeon]
MDTTTIKLYGETKLQLNQFREYKNESYDEIVKKLVYIARTVGKDPKLSSQTVRDIEAARERLRNGEFYSEQQVAKMLGLK